MAPSHMFRLHTLIQYHFIIILVQQECLPQAMYGHDIICQAKSGTGKTAVFVLATLQHVSFTRSSSETTSDFPTTEPRARILA